MLAPVRSLPLQLCWRFYQGVTTAAALSLWPWFRWRLSRRGQGESFAARLGFALPEVPPAPSPSLWLHGVSVGEIQAAAPLVQELRRYLAPGQILISTGTETGQIAARRLFAPAHPVFYYPLDWPYAVRRYLQHLRPRVYAALETEIWPDFLLTARQMGVRLALLNARLSDQSLRRYLKFRRYLSEIINIFSFIAAGSQVDAARFLELGAAPTKVVVTGSSKLARTVDDRLRAQAALYGEVLQVREDQPVFLAASTHPGEEEVLIAAYRRLRQEFPALRLWLAPRHPERAVAVAALLEKAGLAWQSWEKIRHRAPVRPGTVIVIDTVGDLFALYGLATLVFVGGSLVPHGGQNFLEPAAWGKVPVTGPYLHNFRYAQEILTQAAALFIVRQAAELVTLGRRLLAQPAEREAYGQRARLALQPHQGAAIRQATLLWQLFSAPAPEEFSPQNWISNRELMESSL